MFCQLLKFESAAKYIGYERFLLDNHQNVFTAPAMQGQCPKVADPKSVGRITYKDINDASGLVASQSNPKIFWTLNRSGKYPCIYAVDVANNGNMKYKLCLDGSGVQHQDWEAIATGPCTQR